MVESRCQLLRATGFRDHRRRERGAAVKTRLACWMAAKLLSQHRGGLLVGMGNVLSASGYPWLDPRSGRRTEPPGAGMRGFLPTAFRPARNARSPYARR